MKKNATLYAIGVGPGAPDLITIRAIETLQKVDVVLAATRRGNEESLALEIARPHLPANVSIVQLDFPMTRDPALLKSAWAQAAHDTLALLKEGKNCAFLTLGDPLIYSTFAYLERTLRSIAPHIPITIIPGITSFQAACAKLHIPLCEAEENLHILSGINSQENLERQLQNTDTAIILKAYRNYPAILKALESTARDKNAILISHVEQPQEKVQQGALDTLQSPPYLTLIISKKPK